MEEIKETLIEIVKNQLEECKKENKVPSNELLDTIRTLFCFI